MYKAFQIYHRRELKENGRPETGRNRGRIARNTHNRNVSSSILDKFPVTGVISDVSTPRKYPAHVVGTRYIGRPCGRRDATTRASRYVHVHVEAPPGSSLTSFTGPVQPAYHRRERNLLIHGLRETPGFSFPARYPLTSSTASKRSREIAFIFSCREKIETRTCTELLKAQQSIEYFSKQNVMKTDSTANEQKYSK